MKRNWVRVLGSVMAASLAMNTLGVWGSENKQGVETSNSLSLLENVELETQEQADETERENDLELTAMQRNAINMLNYMTMLTQEINDSKESRLFLETIYNSLFENIYPNAVDTRTQAQITTTQDTLEAYRMIAVKRERLEYIYEQNRAQALRQAIPNPVGLLSAVQSGSLIKAAASVVYMAVDSAANYASAKSQADMQYLKDGWDLEDSEDAEVHNSRKAANNYLLNMVRDNSLPGDYALNPESIKKFVEWKNNTNVVRRIAWLETNRDKYKEFGPYWLELAKSYYENEDYEQCLNCVDCYEEVSTRILRQDFDYAEIMPMAIVSAKETQDIKGYIELADKYTTVIDKNAKETDSTLRYFMAQIYIDMYANTKNNAYLEKAYKVAFDNVNILVDEQKALNASYMADVEKIKPTEGATKRQKKEVKEYNKLLKEERKIALPPVSEAFYLNCDLLFALADELNKSVEEQERIMAIIHENGNEIFLTKVLDNRFWFDKETKLIKEKDIDLNFDGDILTVPVICATDRSVIKATVKSKDGEKIFDDWVVKEVERPKKSKVSDYVVTFTSEAAKDYEYNPGDKVNLTIMPVAETSEETLEFSFDAVKQKKMLVFNGVDFERR